VAHHLNAGLAHHRDGLGARCWDDIAEGPRLGACLEAHRGGFVRGPTNRLDALDIFEWAYCPAVRHREMSPWDAVLAHPVLKAARACQIAARMVGRHQA
jgi:hypothetical protein